MVNQYCHGHQDIVSIFLVFPHYTRRYKIIGEIGNVQLKLSKLMHGIAEILK